MKYHILSGFIVFSLLMNSMVAIHAQTGAKAKLVIYQQSSWKGCKQPRMSMQYRLSASSQSPMPKGASASYHDYQMNFNKRKMGITIHYQHPGLYSYYVSQKCQTRYQGMSYDHNIYHVRVMVYYQNGKLQAVQELPVNRNGFKEETMTFHNSYHKKTPVHHQKHPSQGQHSDKDKTRSLTSHKVKTGDTTIIGIWIVTMISSFIMMLLFIVLGKRKKEKEDENNI